MKIKTLVSALALVAATTFGAGQAFAVTINGTEIPADQVGIIVQHCEALAANDQAGDNSPTNEATTSTGNDNGSDSANSSNSAQGETGVSGQNLVVDLDTVSLGVCEESGLLDGSAAASTSAASAADNAMAADAMAAEPMDMANLTPAQRTMVEDQCRALQTADANTSTTANSTDTTTNNDNSSDSSATQNTDETGMDMTVTAEMCAELGIE